MILIFEQDVRRHNGSRFNWRPGWFSGRWADGRGWRAYWGLWSISYYPSPGLREFFNRIEAGVTSWQGGSETR